MIGQTAEDFIKHTPLNVGLCIKARICLKYNGIAKKPATKNEYLKTIL